MHFSEAECGFVCRTPIEWHCHYNNWKRLQMFAFPAHWWNKQLKPGFQHRNYNIGGKYQMWVSNCNLLKLLALLWGRSVFSAGQRQSLQVSLPQHVMTKSLIGGSAIPFFYRKGWKNKKSRGQTILTPLPLIHTGLSQHLEPTKFNPFFHQKLLIYHHFTMW